MKVLDEEQEGVVRHELSSDGKSFYYQDVASGRSCLRALLVDLHVGLVDDLCAEGLSLPACPKLCDLHLWILGLGNEPRHLHRIPRLSEAPREVP